MNVQWLVNGYSDSCVDAADRGLAYGDGLFETMAARGGRIARLGYHLERLAEGCARLGIPRPDPDLVTAEIERLIAGVDRAVAKLVLTRGSGGRGYRPPRRAEPTRILGIFPWPEYGASHYTRGIVLESVSIPIGENARLAGLKHLCRLEQVLAQMELEGGAADEGLQKTARGYIVGGTSSNVFIVRDGRVSTPSVSKCGVRGVMRRLVIEACAVQGVPVAEARLLDADLHAADELFVTNALAGVRPVREYDGRAYDVGPVTRSLQRATDTDAES